MPRSLQEAEQQPARGLESQGALVSLDGGNTLLSLAARVGANSIVSTQEMLLT